MYYNCQRIGSTLFSYNYWCHVTSTLYKLGTSLRRTVMAGREGVRLTGELTVINCNHIACSLSLIISSTHF